MKAIKVVDSNSDNETMTSLELAKAFMTELDKAKALIDKLTWALLLSNAFLVVVLSQLPWS